jgi:hypothetical protein
MQLIVTLQRRQQVWRFPAYVDRDTSEVGRVRIRYAPIAPTRVEIFVLICASYPRVLRFLRFHRLLESVSY